MGVEADIEALAVAYGVRMAWGSLVEIGGFEGIVVSTRGQYIGVIFDEDKEERVRYFHPKDDSVKYFNIIPVTNIKQWWVKAPGFSWEDLDNLMVVYASSYAKASYKGWQILDAAGLAARDDMLLMRSKRKYSDDDRERWRKKGKTDDGRKCRK